MTKLIDELYELASRLSESCNPDEAITVSLAAEHIEYLEQENAELKTKENIAKARAVKEAAEISKTAHYAGNERACSYPELLIYAKRLEQGDNKGA